MISLTANANPPTVGWPLISGALPPGLNLNATGQILGTPSIVGSYSFTLLAQLGTSSVSVSQVFSISVYQGQVVIQNSTLPVAYSGQPSSATLTSNVISTTWALNSLFLLPPGITFNAATATFSGATTVTGAYKLQVQATATNYATATKNFTLYVASAQLSIVETSIPIAIQGTGYRVTLTPSGGLAPYSWSLASTNNQGLLIDPNNGTISGIPPNLGSFTLVVRLSDSTNAAPFVQAFPLLVVAPLSVTTSSLAAAVPLTAYSQTLSAGGGQAPFTWALVANSGLLPPGLSLSTRGIISGTVAFNATGVYTFIGPSHGCRQPRGDKDSVHCDRIGVDDWHCFFARCNRRQSLFANALYRGRDRSVCVVRCCGPASRRPDTECIHGSHIRHGHNRGRLGFHRSSFRFHARQRAHDPEGADVKR